MLIRGVIDHQLGDDAHAAAVRLADEALEIGHAAVGGMDVLVVGDVVAVVAQRRRVERQQPQRRDAEILQVVELAPQALEIADAVIGGVEERLDVQLIDDRVLVPLRIAHRRLRRAIAAALASRPAGASSGGVMRSPLSGAGGKRQQLRCRKIPCHELIPYRFMLGPRPSSGDLGGRCGQFDDDLCRS